MADPQGFLKAGRELPERRPVDVRIRDWQEVYEDFPPERLTHRTPGVTQIQVLMKMGLVNVDNPHLSLTHLLIQPLKVSHKFGALGGIVFAQQFLALFPTYSGLFEDRPQGIATDRTSQFVGNPLSEFFQSPAVPAQLVVNRLAVCDNIDDLYLL